MVQRVSNVLRRRARRGAVLLATVGTANAALASTAFVVGSIQVVSASASGTAATVGSTTCAVSADGSLVLFSSGASTLVAGDSNRTDDLFLKNLATGAITRVTTQSSGAQFAAGGNCLATTMTPDGRVVAFNSGPAVFAKNTQTGLLAPASPPAGTAPQVTGYFGGVLSDDFTKLVFMTKRETIYAGPELFVHVIPARLILRHLSDGNLVVLSTDNGIVAESEVVSNRFAISSDGTRVAVASSSASLWPGDTNSGADVFVRNLVDSTTLLASSTSTGVPDVTTVCCNSFYWNSAVVSSTQFAFVTGQPSSLGDRGLYLKDLASGARELGLSDADGEGAKLSGDGRKLVFSRLYSGWDRRVFVRDRSTGAETLASASAGASGVASNGNSTEPMISRDGTRGVFGSSARNLVLPRPPVNVAQIYLKTVGTATVAPQRW